MEWASDNSTDRIECFDNYYSCLQRNEWNLFYIDITGYNSFNL